MWYYVYILQSEKDGEFYTGYTKDLKLRFEQHQKGLVESTKNRQPFPAGASLQLVPIMKSRPARGDF